jgi:hypothetical protein
MLDNNFSPSILNATYDPSLHLDDPSFTTKVNLRFNCEICKNRWKTMHGTILTRFVVADKELRFRVRVYRHKCRRCLQWGDPFVTNYQKAKVTSRTAEMIGHVYFKQGKELMKMILLHLGISDEYYDVFFDTEIGVQELLEIPNLAAINQELSNNQFDDTLKKLGEMAEQWGLEPLTWEELRRICNFVWDKYGNKVPQNKFQLDPQFIATFLRNILSVRLLLERNNQEN